MRGILRQAIGKPAGPANLGEAIHRRFAALVSRLAGYEDVNDAGRLCRDPVLRQLVGGRAVKRGATNLPDGKRRDRLIAEIDAMIVEDFAGRVLPFDSAAAVAFAAIYLQHRNAGRPSSFPDCEIAATARAHGAAMATRNVADFERCGVDVIASWATAGGG